MRGIILERATRTAAVAWFCGLMVATAAQAADRWPADVCQEMIKLEAVDARSYASLPTALATARGDVLFMLQAHCGVDVRAKLATDDAANRSAASTPHHSHAQTRDPVFCNTVKVGDGLSSTVCN